METRESETREQEERKALLSEYRKILRVANFNKNDEQARLIRKAFDVAQQAHKGVRRKSGEAYIFHPLAVARIVAEEIGLGKTAIICALLHDVVEDTDLDIDYIEAQFGKKVADIVDGLTKIEEVFDQSKSLQQENFRKILLTLADDVRVILIKIADRLHNMRTLESMRKDKQLKIASETLYIYAPLAHRLGFYNLKSELEDLSLKYKAPSIYDEISTKLKKSKAVRSRFINKFTHPITKILEKDGVHFKVESRTKSIYSIWNKMRKKSIPFEEVYDVFAVRFILDVPLENEKAMCWKIYSIITDFYKPNPDRLRDWISTPKVNGYESLHTTVMSPTGKWVEVQIRSKRMDEIAEKGFAAHWKYKEQTHHEGALDKWISRIREILEEHETDAIDFVDDFKLNLFAKEIFVFTPKGDIKSLPHNSTALDFAYEIHTELGHHCLGAKVDKKLVPLSHKLESGDQVEILRSKAQHPIPEWLDFTVTGKAKAAIKAYLKKEKRKKAKAGEKKLREAFDALSIDFTDSNLNALSTIFKTATVTDIFYRFGTGSLNLTDIERLPRENGVLQLKKTRKGNGIKTLEEIVEATRGKKDALVIGAGQRKLVYKIADCCNPIPGDDVVGFVTHEGVISIHRISCENVVPIMSNHGYRVIKARWGEEQQIAFQAGIEMSGFDRTGMVNEITKVISNEMDVEMRSISFDSTDGVFTGRVLVYVNDTAQLKNLQEKLEAVEGITKVNRIE